MGWRDKTQYCQCCLASVASRMYFSLKKHCVTLPIVCKLKRTFCKPSSDWALSIPCQHLRRILVTTRRGFVFFSQSTVSPIEHSVTILRSCKDPCLQFSGLCSKCLKQKQAGLNWKLKNTDLLQTGTSFWIFQNR